ncbi:hypothetical protein LEP1GSC192_0867 [Leptospira sp. B5-022]|nr:hypothetical protein LEP1GSC192_0867 [Leptospira sp. B5-022]
MGSGPEFFLFGSFFFRFKPILIKEIQGKSHSNNFGLAQATITVIEKERIGNVG